MALLALPAGTVHAQAPADSLAALLQGRILAAPADQPVVCRSDIPCRSNQLKEFYRQRAFRPAWTDGLTMLPDAMALVGVLREADQHGLIARDYRLDTVQALLGDVWKTTARGEKPDPQRLADLDLLLTDAFFLYGSHMLAGRKDPNRLYETWVATPRTADLAGLLRDSLDRHQVRRALKGLEPLYPGYDDLQQALARYRQIAAAGGWPAIPAGETLRKGVRDKRVPLLRQRLLISGDFDAPEAETESRFDEGLDRAVRTFQYRHGLKIDGAVRTETLAALNVPVAHRIRQIEMNLERWRWLPENLGDRYIIVNITDFGLEVIGGGRAAMTMRVIPGKRVHNERVDMRTPVFSATMTHLEINPYWNVPHSIATKEFLKEIKKDPEYLTKKNMKLFAGRQVIDPKTVDWSTIHEKNFRYMIRQEPGAFNALSHIKFLFPNRFDVYLHDTPTRNLFKRAQRDFSHGCMRVERPVDLAVYLLDDPARWSQQQIQTAIRKGKNQSVNLPRPITVHVQYWTAWADRDGMVQFRNDLYGYEPTLERALYGTPGTPSPRPKKARPKEVKNVVAVQPYYP